MEHQQTKGRLPAAVVGMVEGYQKLPSWVLLPQMFLAAGWGRAGLAHAIDPRWWNGAEVLDFLATMTDHRVGLYHYVLTGIVRPRPTTTAVVVVVGEFVIAGMLAINYRPLAALGLGAFLNLQFILAGVVNPSIFYLVASLGIVIWRLEVLASSGTIRRAAQLVPIIVVGAAVSLAPSVGSLNPEAAIEDPALVLIFLGVLTTAAVWWVEHRTGLANVTLAALTDELADERRSTSQPTGWPAPIVWSAVAVTAVVVGALTALGAVADGYSAGGQEAAERRNGAAAGEATTSEERGGLGAPYPFGQSVTIYYDDLEQSVEREWIVQVLETVADIGGDTGDGFADAVGRSGAAGHLASTRIRLTYLKGPKPGPVRQIRLRAVGASGNVFDATSEGCGPSDDRLDPATELPPDAAIEGRVCWWVEADQLPSLVLEVEAEPADGVVYLDLG